MILSTSGSYDARHPIARSGDISRTGAHVAGDPGERTQSAATELTRAGNTGPLPPLGLCSDEESWFVVFEAESADAMRDIARLAALPPACVSAAIIQS